MLQLALNGPLAGVRRTFHEIVLPKIKHYFKNFLLFSFAADFAADFVGRS
jgi:hypothetical protein